MDAELAFKCVSILFRMPCDLSGVAAALLSAIAAGRLDWVPGHDHRHHI
jgi:hypothetical protein